MKAGFIGAGKVGFSLGKYLAENGIQVTGFYLYKAFHKFNRHCKRKRYALYHGARRRHIRSMGAYTQSADKK